ncbi:gp16 family protein [Planktotalea sp.]|uniref:gp16 family protein n=1 Tax=Planktotalea sp. TaxID=2029877 RepID=UPI003D6C45C9
MPRDPVLAQIHIAKKELRLDDETYRAVLTRVTGKSSSKDLGGPQRKKVLAELKRLGFKPKSKFSKRPASSKPYVRKVFGLWGELKRAGIWRDPDPQSLRNFVKKMTGCDDPEWLEYHQASQVIEALKKMKERANG